MASLKLALPETLKHEGVRFRKGKPIPGRTGYVNHPMDPGGETNMGVTRRVARRFGYRGPMKSIPYSTVLKIYDRGYWSKSRCGSIPHQGIAAELFDTAVNCGVKTAGRFLQNAMNKLNRGGRDWSEVTVDGAVGPATIRVLKKALAFAPYIAVCIQRLQDSQQAVRYMQLCDKKPKFEVFMPGWTRTRVGVKT